MSSHFRRLHNFDARHQRWALPGILPSGGRRAGPPSILHWFFTSILCITLMSVCNCIYMCCVFFNIFGICFSIFWYINIVYTFCYIWFYFVKLSQSLWLLATRIPPCSWRTQCGETLVSSFYFVCILYAIYLFFILAALLAGLQKELTDSLASAKLWGAVCLHEYSCRQWAPHDCMQRWALADVCRKYAIYLYT